MVQKASLIPAFVIPEQRRRSPSPVPPTLRAFGHRLCPETPCLTSPNSTAESSYFPKMAPDNDTREDQLIKRMEEMSRQLETLKVKSSQPFERDFTVDPPFSAKS